MEYSNLIIIMIIKAVKQYQRIFSKYFFATIETKRPQYTPPPSQFNTFKKHLQNIENVESRNAAAQLLAKLESDEQLYKERLLEIAKEYQRESQQNKDIVDIFERNVRLQEQIDDQIEENKQIENRCYKAIDHNKVYGIARIAKEVIETADHIKQAISIVEASNAENKVAQLSELTRTQNQLFKVFGKYEIQEFNPIEELFDPNQHQSIAFIETEDVEKKNRIAEVKRTGFKLKEMLLRSAFVVIYK